ncbi:MAG: cysteine--tRNA ligase [bacterium]
MGIRVHNTLSGTKEDFVPLRDGHVGIYFCGMTVQERPHIGHMRACMVFDIFRRYLEYRGFDVVLIQNITDVDDKVIEKARDQGTDYRRVAQGYTDEYLYASDTLGIKRSTFYPRATQHIQEIISLIESLFKRGMAYQVDGDVYYEVSKFKGYGKLSKKKVSDLISGARVAVDERKRSPADFALWKASREGEPWWESPWGRGRPGWHIECSAMSMHYLGETFDIHGGGTDLIFPHHENEIAQSEAATGKPFAKYWLHNEWVTLGGEKMSKSTGHFVPITEILKQYEPDIIRVYLLSTHYRSQIEFGDERLASTKSGLERLQNALSLKGAEGELDFSSLSPEEAEVFSSISKSHETFESAMDDDFNTSRALSVLFDLAKLANKVEKDGMDLRLITAAQKNLRELGAVLGLFQSRKEEVSDSLINSLIESIIDVRGVLRNGRDFKSADLIRSHLERLGIRLEDKPEGTVWKRK